MKFKLLLGIIAVSYWKILGKSILVQKWNSTFLVVLLVPTFNLDAGGRDSLSQQVDGLAGVDAGVSGSDVIDSQGHVTKVQGCLQSWT